MHSSDQTIIETMNRDPENGFRLLMTKYQSPVYWHVRRMVVSHANAQDITQETFIRVYRSFSSFQSKSSLKTWIFRIAINETLRFLDKVKGENVSLDDPEVFFNTFSDEYIDYTETENIIFQKAVLSVPTKQRAVFNLRYYDEMEYDDIANAMNCTVSTAKTNYHYAKEKIKNYLKENSLLG